VLPLPASFGLVFRQSDSTSRPMSLLMMKSMKMPMAASLVMMNEHLVSFSNPLFSPLTLDVVSQFEKFLMMNLTMTKTWMKTTMKEVLMLWPFSFPFDSDGCSVCLVILVPVSSSLLV